MLILLCFFIITVVLSLIAYRVIKMQETDCENRMMQSYLISMESFYHMIQNRIEATRRYRHDLAKHIQTLEVMIQQENKDEYQKCMEELKKGYHQLQQSSYCGDDIINTVLSIKQQQCEEKQIPLQVQIKDAVYAAVDEMDMVSLLHNVLDNAIEASEQIPQGASRGIFFSMGKEDQKIRIKSSNFIKPGSEINFKTWKEDKEVHGLGMKIIDSIVKKYNGKQEINVNSQEGKLELEIWLYCDGTIKNRNENIT